MKRYLLSIAVIAATSSLLAQSFIQWNIPSFADYEDRVFDNNSKFTVIDFDGDGRPDLIDAEDDNNQFNPYMNGNQMYWKVYLNNGSGFSPSSMQWNVPDADDYMDRVHGSNTKFFTIDFTGDGRPDLVDAEDNNNQFNPYMNGNQKYWKVYENTGSGFSSTAIQWNIPSFADYEDRVFDNNSKFYVLDMNGDGKPDLIDAEDDNNQFNPYMNGGQMYWKVYLNTGSGFSATSTQWNVPDAADYMDRVIGSNTKFYVTDFDGDGLPDFIDAEDNNNQFNPYMNGGQKYWKVYLNTGSGFSASSVQWNIPELNDTDDRVFQSNSKFYVAEVNGDGKPDLIDAEDNNNQFNPYMNGSQQYWKVYFNTGSGFSATASQYSIADLDDYDDRVIGSNTKFYFMDFDGDGMCDVIDAEDNNNEFNPYAAGNQKYWKVYLSPFLSIDEYVSEENQTVIYPNPANGFIQIANGGQNVNSVSIVSLNGQVLIEFKNINSTMKMDVSDLNSGVYLVRLGNNENIEIQKLIIQ